MPAIMKAVQIPHPKGDFEVVERPIPEPARNQVRIKVEACGICHSDVLVKEGLWPGLQYPRVPGHEIAGRVDAAGERAKKWKKRKGGWGGGDGGGGVVFWGKRPRGFVKCKETQNNRDG